MKEKLLLVINPKAGHGLAPRIEKYIAQSGLQERYSVEISHTHYRNHAKELSLAAAQQQYACVVAVGGDGTVNEVASSLVNTQTALAIIPAGSGNGLARHLTYPLKALAALQKIKNAKTETIDTLLINNRFAVNVSGFGFDGFVAWRFDEYGKRGLSSYTTIALQEYFKYPAIHFDIYIDEKELNMEAHMVVLANASQFGNAAIIAPQADLQDGKMDIIIIKRPPIYKVPSTFYHLFNGTLQPNDYVKMYTCKNIIIMSSRPIHLHIDGEPVEPVQKLTATVQPSSLKVMI